MYTTIAAVCAIFIYLSYLLPVAAGLFAFRRTWTHMGPFQLGSWYPPVAVLCIVGCAVLIYVGVQPPNDKALYVIIAAAILAPILWFGLERKRFSGPPTGESIDKRQAQIALDEKAVGEADLPEVA